MILYENSTVTGIKIKIIKQKLGREVDYGSSSYN